MTDRDETPDVLTEARELLDGITTWPWRRPKQLLGIPNGGIFAGTKEVSIVCQTRPGDADGEFIAAAPDLVSRLAGEVERLRADAEARLLDLATATNSAMTAMAERDEALAAIERVRVLQPIACGKHRVLRVEDVARALDGGERS